MVGLIVQRMHMLLEDICHIFGFVVQIFLSLRKCIYLYRITNTLAKK